jgi:TatD DNase family protein
MLVDTHAHLYADEFTNDRDSMILNAIHSGVTKMILPNIDADSVNGMLELATSYPEHCFPLIGLHPTSVDSNFRDQLKQIDNLLKEQKFYGIGETGIDLYWDKTWQKEQEKSFRWHLQMARDMNLPVVIHVRNSFNEVYTILKEEQNGTLRGVFHCFSGSYDDALKVIDTGFFLGAGGVVTFKNSTLAAVLSKIDIRHILLETDSPYLAPVPYRGKRNESAYLVGIAEKIAEIYNLPFCRVAETTTGNAELLFGC